MYLFIYLYPSAHLRAADDSSVPSSVRVCRVVPLLRNGGERGRVSNEEERRGRGRPA